MKRLAILVAGSLALAACGDREVLLEGERLDLDGSAIIDTVVNRAEPLNVPPATVNANWTHVGGSVRHQVDNPALARGLELLWTREIGQGSQRKHRITTDPVVDDGRIVTLDSRALVSAHSTNGELLWSRDLTPASDRSDDASGGGLAAQGGMVYVTSAFGSLTALDGATGRVLWSQDLGTAPSGAPTVFEGVVYLATRDEVGWAVDAENGRILWQAFGALGDHGISGGSSPAIAGPLVIFPFSSGQLVAVVRGTGAQAWSASVAGQRLGRSFSRVSELTGDPVVVGNTVIAANHTGRSAAFDAATGQSIWRADEGTVTSVWVAGGSAFMATDENRLVRIDAATGDVIWAIDLPFFRHERLKKRKAIYTHYGPVLAGGRLILASDDEMLREFDPVTGALIAATRLPGDAVSAPVIAGQTMYLLTSKGELHAFR